LDGLASVSVGRGQRSNHVFQLLRDVKFHSVKHLYSSEDFPMLIEKPKPLIPVVCPGLEPDLVFKDPSARSLLHAKVVGRHVERFALSAAIEFWLLESRVIAGSSSRLARNGEVL